MGCLSRSRIWPKLSSEWKELRAKVFSASLSPHLAHHHHHPAASQKHPDSHGKDMKLGNAKMKGYIVSLNGRIHAFCGLYRG